MTAFALAGSRALVTGAAGGIGSAIAIALAEAGADLVLTDRPGTALRADVAAALRATDRRVHWREQDLARVDELGDFVNAVTAAAGAIDVLVSNAGVVELARVGDIDPAAWRRTMAVDLDAAFFLSQAVARRMIDDGIRGRIILMSSKNGLVAEPALTAYNTAKGGLQLMMQSLASELGEFGITVNSVCPGVVDTGFASDFDIDWERFIPYYLEHIPLEHRFARVEEIALPVVFLASAAASYITGHALVVDGGVLAQQLPRLQFLPPTRKQDETPCTHTSF